MRPRPKLPLSGLLITALYILTSCNQSGRGGSPSLGNEPSVSATRTDVLTNRYDNARTGATLAESWLHTGNVNVQQFGKLFTRSVVGQIYAQPLVVSNFTLPDGSLKNLVIVATMHNNVYAFDADDASASAPVWEINVGPSFPFSDYGNNSDITDRVGILSTPVIDRESNTIYLVAATRENGEFFYKLHALDLATGAEKLDGPAVIAGSAPGTTYDAVNGVISFDASMHLQRPGLLLTKGQLVFGFASHFDAQPYHGWVFSYDAKTLARTAVNIASQNSQGAGIWQSGAGLSTDGAGNIFGVTGNAFSANAANPTDRTESIIKWSLSDLQQVDWFTPANWQQLDQADYDLGVDGAILLPETNYLVSGAKSGMLYIMNRDSLGQLQPDDVGVRQEFQAVYNDNSRHIHGNPVYWNGPQGKRIYVWGENDYLRSFALRSDGYFATQAVSQSPMKAAQNSMPGGIVAISANGSQAGTGILWASLVLDGDANHSDRAGVLRAFDASDLSHELWNSEQNPGRDSLGLFAKFNQPTIANGKVYMATFSNQLVVYGLLPNQPVSIPVIVPLQPIPLAPPADPVMLRSASGNLCLAASGNNSGDAYQVTECTHDAPQSFRLDLGGQITYNGLCTDVFGSANGNPVGIYTCTGGVNQKWNLMSNGEVRGVFGLCLTVNTPATGGAVSAQTCLGYATQQWSPVNF